MKKFIRAEILLEEFMKPKEITARQVAADMDVPTESDQRNREWSPPDHG